MHQTEEDKYYEAIRKLSQKNSNLTKGEQVIKLNRLKYNVIKEIEDIEKAVHVGNIFCSSNHLKVGLMDLG